MPFSNRCFLQLLLLLGIVFFIGCSNESSHESNSLHLTGLEECIVVDNFSGTICGKVLAADWVTPVAGTRIYLPNHSRSSSCITNNAGEYACHVPKERSKGALTAFVFDPPWRFKKNVAIPVRPGSIQKVADYSVRWGWFKPD